MGILRQAPSAVSTEGSWSRGRVDDRVREKEQLIWRGFHVLRKTRRARDGRAPTGNGLRRRPGQTIAHPRSLGSDAAGRSLVRLPGLDLASQLPHVALAE